MEAKDGTCGCFNAAFINSSQFLPVKYELEHWHVTNLHSCVKGLEAWVPTDNGACPIIPVIREELDHCNWNLHRSRTLHTDLRVNSRSGTILHDSALIHQKVSFQPPMSPWKSARHQIQLKYKPGFLYPEEFQGSPFSQDYTLPTS